MKKGKNGGSERTKKKFFYVKMNITIFAKWASRSILLIVFFICISFFFLYSYFLR